MKRPYVLIRKDRVGKNQLERKIYLGAEERTLAGFELIEKLLLFKDTEFKLEILKEDEADEEEYERLKYAIIREAERLGIKKTEQFEEIVDLYFKAFKKLFSAADHYPLDCDWAAALTTDIFDECLNYEVTVMKSKEINHFFTEITDKAGVLWTFDPSAEQFQELFGEQYNSSRYEKKMNENKI